MKPLLMYTHLGKQALAVCSAVCATALARDLDYSGDPAALETATLVAWSVTSKKPIDCVHCANCLALIYRPKVCFFHGQDCRELDDQLAQIVADETDE